MPQVAAGEAGGREREAQQAPRRAWTRGSGNRIPRTRVQVVLMTGLVIASSAAAPSAGLWLMHSASSRRRLAAVSPSAKPVANPAQQRVIQRVAAVVSLAVTGPAHPLRSRAATRASTRRSSARCHR